MTTSAYDILFYLAECVIIFTWSNKLIEKKILIHLKILQIDKEIEKIAKLCKYRNSSTRSKVKMASPLTIQ